MNLEVYYAERRVGTIVPEGDFRMRFEYDPVWRDGPDGFPVSVSLPLSGDYVRGREDHRFFANLLPEAGAREALCRSLGISRDNDYELLAAVGGEYAGALRILPEDSWGTEVPGYEAIRSEDSSSNSRTLFSRA